MSAARVQDDWSGSKDFYIADNDFNGRHDPDHMMGWTGALWQQFPAIPNCCTSEYAIKVYGQGHVVAYNHVTNFHDGIDFATYGAPDGVTQPDGTSAKEIRDRFPESNDFYGNDISNMGDNCIEMDGGGRNMRVFGNRCFNLADGAFSVQPGFGGPIYWIRNVVYNTFNGALKYYRRLRRASSPTTTPSSAQGGPARRRTCISATICSWRWAIMDPVFALTLARQHQRHGL